MYPVLVGATGALEIASSVRVVVAVTEVPEFVSKLTFRVLAFHLAKRVKFAVLPWV